MQHSKLSFSKIIIRLVFLALAASFFYGIIVNIGRLSETEGALNNRGVPTVQATVTNVEARETSSKYVYYYDVTYTVDGIEYTKTISGIPRTSVGNTVTLYYNPDSPSELIFPEDLENVIWGIVIMVVIELFLVVVFFAGFYSEIRRRKKSHFASFEKKRKKFNTAYLLPIFVIGTFAAAIIFLTAKAFNYSESSLKAKGMLPVQATISDIKAEKSSSGTKHSSTVTYKYYASYEVDGVSYFSRVEQMAENSDKMFSIGDVVTVYYDPDNPADIAYPTSSSDVGFIIFMIVMVAIAAAAFLILPLKKKAQQHIQEHGQEYGQGQYEQQYGQEKQEIGYQQLGYSRKYQDSASQQNSQPEQKHESQIYRF